MSILDQKFTADDIVRMETSLAYDGDARKEGEVYDVEVDVSLAGITVRELIDKAIAQKKVELQRVWRAEDKGGSMETKEQFEKAVEDKFVDQVPKMHFSIIGTKPEKVKTPEQLEAEMEAAEAQMTDEQLEAQLKRLQERLGK